MEYLELTLPLNHEYMPDEVFPTATNCFLGSRYHPDKGIVVGSETGTCITLPAVFSEFRKTTRLNELPIEKLFLRPATVLDISKEGGEEITTQDFQQAFKVSVPEPGDAILIRTGWGDSGACREPGPRYMLESPHFSVEAAEFLAGMLVEKKSDLLLTDLAMIGRPDRHLIPEWCSLEPRPSPWPSPEARVYLHLYSPDKARKDFAAEIALAKAGVMTVKRLIHCGAIQGRRVRIIVSPLNVVRGVASTCRVVAVQDGSK